MGRLIYRLSDKYAERMRENLGHAWKGRPQGDFRKVLNASIVETGKGAAELLWIWCRPLAEVTASVKACYGWEHIEAARARGKGIIFLTPHLGCFDVSALYVAEHMPLTVLYRPPKLIWLEQVMRNGRERAQLRLARTDVGGVRQLYKALKRAEAIGLLPDQVPGNGEGEWADFFGRPAYTMTLIGRLVKSSGASVVMTSAERLAHGSGYILRFTPLNFVADLPISRQVNAALEELVLINPAQYLWSYNRYKIPAGIKPASTQDVNPI
ncbi:acyltransferase [Candidatus Nitrotoga sp. AM1P]|nr:acyltransferase [Candidatus Nitrotoga sp. AM1P]